MRHNIDTHRDKPLQAAEERSAELRGQLFRHPSEEANWIAREIAALRLLTSGSRDQKALKRLSRIEGAATIAVQPLEVDQHEMRPPRGGGILR